MRIVRIFFTLDIRRGMHAGELFLTEKCLRGLNFTNLMLGQT